MKAGFAELHIKDNREAIAKFEANIRAADAEISSLEERLVNLQTSNVFKPRLAIIGGASGLFAGAVMGNKNSADANSQSSANEFQPLP